MPSDEVDVCPHCGSENELHEGEPREIDPTEMEMSDADICEAS